MVEMLSLSKAARFAGVSRTVLQRRISDGDLLSFEGAVRLSDLLRVFPAARPEDDAQIKRMQTIKEAALTKPMPDDSPSEFAQLRLQVENLEQEAGALRKERDDYREIVDTAAEKLLDIQERCDERQRLMLETVISWVLQRIKRHG